MPINRPAAVVSSASEMPSATRFGFPVPARLMTSKARIMPTTVPKRPSIGARFAMTPNARRLRERTVDSCWPAPTMARSISPTPRCRRASPACNTRASGASNRSQARAAPSKSPRRQHCPERTTSPSGRIFFRRREARRSSATMSAMTEQSPRGIIV